ncbi:hypothetical protein [Pseudoduganella sp. UC29_106]|uniref:hypothetical protein n=1 Tax=Pseudoduganella sp. UC29_106 TaxID=3374553 RepID=UPI0037571233
MKTIRQQLLVGLLCATIASAIGAGAMLYHSLQVETGELADLQLRQLVSALPGRIRTRRLPAGSRGSRGRIHPAGLGPEGQATVCLPPESADAQLQHAWLLDRNDQRAGLARLWRSAPQAVRAGEPAAAGAQ